MRFAIFAAMMLIALSVPSVHADIITSGDGGAAFATDMSAMQCAKPDVQAVYICTGNVVEAVSRIPGEGSTFYKPDGRVIQCPIVPPTDMGAECVQLLSPNICGNQSVCPETVYGPAQPPPSPPQQPQENVTAGQNESTPPSGTNVSPQQQTESSSGVSNQTSTKIIPQVNTTGPSNQDAIVFGVVIGGMVVLAILHYMYMKSKGSDI